MKIICNFNEETKEYIASTTINSTLYYTYSKESAEAAIEELKQITAVDPMMSEAEKDIEELSAAFPEDE